VVITGLGAITPLGLTIDDFWQGLSAGKCGIAPITYFDASRYPAKVAGEIRGFKPENYMNLKRADRSSRPAHYAIAAAGMAVKQAGLDMSREKQDRVGVIIATVGMPCLITDQAEVLKIKGPGRIDPLLASKVAASMIGIHVGMELSARGINSTLNSACASGNDSLGEALMHLRLGHADVMVAGGTDANVNDIAMASTGIVGALTRNPDPMKACRPFDKERNGFVFGEGAGILVLETYEHAKARGARMIAELAGAGWSFDAYNETAPFDQMQAVAMRAAIQDAGLKPDDVDYINAHGTSTQLNDSTETRAVKLVFGQRAYKIPMSSNKSMIGHLACAAGSVEAVASVLTIQHGLIPPTIGYQTLDPECDLDYVPNTARRQQVNVCLSNSFGMGGQNCCLIIKHLVE
jgi:3-oxoacyl-[acyl-carrier-protein] synthase II